jgi:hypothetical protein
MPQDKFYIGEVISRIKSAKESLPLILANDAKNDFLNNFRQQGFDGKKWQEVKRRIPGTPEYKYPKTKDPGRHTRAILQGKGSGRLRKDVANSVRTGHPIKDGYVLEVNNEYGIYHNEGAEHLPQRQFVGDTPRLREALKLKIKTHIDACFKA